MGLIETKDAQRSKTTIMKAFLILMLSAPVTLLFYGCATPVGYSEKPMQRSDKNTTYNVEDHEDGFTITVFYSRYQFVPESDAVSAAGKSALLSAAYEVADARGRRIQEINEQRIKMSMGRNGVSGITSWTGTVRAFYQTD
jgi:hypothetical protein